MHTYTRRACVAAAGTLLLAGCIGTSDSATGPEASGADAEPEHETERPDSGAGPPTMDRGLPLPATTETIADAMQRGAGKDAIPSIDDPKFIDASAGDEWLDPGHPVFGVVHNGESKAYPQRVLVWHEIVNDRIGGDRVAVTYCPLTGTAQGFQRGAAQFGVSGQLVNSNLVMYDRETDSYWPQMLATGVTGPHEADELIEYNVIWTTWDRWRSAYPQTALLSDETGYARDYGRDPYGSYDPPSGYYDGRNLLFPQFGDGSAHSFHPKRVVIGARTADGALAVFKDTLAASEVVEFDLDGVPYVVTYDPALDTGWVYRNAEARAVEPTGSEIAVDGTAYSPGELPLESVVRYDAMWFAWEGYYPNTEVVS